MTLSLTSGPLLWYANSALRTQLGPAYTTKFLQQCKPNEYDYSAERHKLLADQPDIDTIVKRIRQGEADQKKEERIKAERVADGEMVRWKQSR